jgi:hypothetical protein
MLPNIASSSPYQAGLLLNAAPDSNYGSDPQDFK